MKTRIIYEINYLDYHLTKLFGDAEYLIYRTKFKSEMEDFKQYLVNEKTSFQITEIRQIKNRQTWEDHSTKIIKEN